VETQMQSLKVILLSFVLLVAGACKKKQEEEPNEVLTFWMVKNPNSQASVKFNALDLNWTELENGQLEIKQVLKVGEEIEIKHRYSAVFF